MANNDKIILEQIIEEQRKALNPSATKSDFFEMFVAGQVLKDFDLSDEEVESGLVGGTGDGGTDGIYTFANGELVQEDFSFDHLKKNVLVEVVIIQSKTGDSYNEDSMNKLAAITKDLFDLNRPVDDFKTVYNEGVRSSVNIFRNLFLGIAAKFPRLNFRYIYATCGDKAAVHPNVARKTDDIKRNLSALFSTANFEFDFIGAADLLELARRQPTTSYEMAVTESLSSKDGYIALVQLKDFYKFISDDAGQLIKNLFESNVRDYQGSTQVNEEIQKSLSERGKEDFWWLNNGVTVVSSKAVQSGKILTIEDPQIVNGQQTSTEIYNFYKEANTEAENRSVMVRIVSVSESASRDRIIKATNSQTSIPPASLRATDKIHRDIEEYLSPFGLYYDRRKNSQKNLGKPVDQIISIAMMAQAIMSIVLQRPDSARARPSTLLKKDEDYRQLFSNEYPVEIYLVASKAIKKVQSFLRAKADLEPKERTNLLFYIAMHASCCLAGKSNPSVQDLAAIKVDGLTDSVLESSLIVVKDLYNALGGNDQAAKGSKLLADLKQSLASHTYALAA